MKKLIKAAVAAAMMAVPAVGNAAVENIDESAEKETQYVGEYSTGLTSLILWEDNNFVIRNSAVSVMGKWSLAGNKMKFSIMDWNETNDGFVCIDTEYFDIQKVNGVISLGDFEKLQH